MSERKLCPTGDYILVQPHEEEAVSAGGILLPAKEGEKKTGVGTLLDFGDDTKWATFRHIGKTVLYGKYAGNEITFEGEDYVVMREKEITLIVEEE